MFRYVQCSHFTAAQQTVLSFYSSTANSAHILQQHSKQCSHFTAAQQTVLTFYSSTANKTHIGCSFPYCLNPAVLLPHTNGEHVQNRSSLNPTQDHNETNYAKWIEGQLGSQNIHALLKWSFWSFFCLHHLKNFTKFRLLSRVHYNPLKEWIMNIFKIKKFWEELTIPTFLQMF